MAKCCQPVPGDDILGFITQGRGISVHRQDCEQLNHLLLQQPERQVEVQWGDKQTQKYQVSLKIIANDRQGLLRDVSTIISNDRISILGMESNSDVMKNSMSMVIKLEVSNGDMLTRLINKVSQIDDVVDVHRV
jgi:GTP pyrophosphokinase